MHMHMYNKATFSLFWKTDTIYALMRPFTVMNFIFLRGGGVVKNIDSGADLIMSNQEL